MNMSNSPPSFSANRFGNTGFTLVEVMVAVTVTSIILLTIYGVFSSVSSAKERLEGEGEDFHRARVLFDRLGREIRGAYYRGGGRGQVFVGGKDDLGRTFLTMSTTATTPLEQHQGGLARVHYLLREDTEEGRPGLTLFRQESPPFLPVNEETAGYRLVAGIESLEFRFFSRGTWSEEWDADSMDSLPMMVEVSLVLRTEEGTRPFLTAFEMPVLEGR